jgi:acetate kinase
MGMTPLEGLIMGTRAGDIDPGMLLHVLRLGLATVDELDYLLNDQSGMLGLSGISNDVRTLENASDHGDENAKLALRMFAYRVSQYIGAYSAVLGGVDALAFAGGIGEHSPQIRALICKNLAFLGIRLEETLNDASMGQEDATIGNPNSPTKVWVIATNEELEVVRETFKLIGGAN